MSGTLKKITRWIPLMLIIIGLFCFYYFDGYQYISFSMLKSKQDIWLAWKNQNYFSAVFIYMLIYTLAVTLSIPGASLITITGGFLFGPIATLYVVISATAGAALLFLAVHTPLKDWLAKKTKHWIYFKRNLQENSFNYLLMIRLIPLFPFWVVNIMAALLSIRLKIFISATFIGIIPGAFIYVMVGNGLHVLFQKEEAPDLAIIFTPAILLPLLALALLSLLPVIYKNLKKKS
ncbi:MAG: hypothetical protein ACD_60C00038G0011 [uncultured bacterium]|nr:MAG: hypothetical protein ACD_60C00038G0011 [uncultured bacterium]